MRRVVLWSVVLIVTLLAGAMGYRMVLSMTQPSEAEAGIPAAKVADHLHAVIEANRTIYATHVVDKMQAKGIIQAAEHWRQEDALLLPAQFLMETGRLTAEKGSGIKYRLISLWPIYVWNAPSTDFERNGLEAINKDPAQPYTGFIKIGQERYFQAIYADLAVSQSCIDCHNTHANSPRRDFKMKDVMGGIVITIPIGN